MTEVLAELLSSKIRAAVLGYLLPRPHVARSLTDLSGLLELPISSLQYECYKLLRLGVLRDHRADGSRYYHANPESPLVTPLTALVVAAIGRDAALRAAIDDVGALDEVFLLERPPEGAAGAPRLVVVGELALEPLDALVARIATALARSPDEIDLAFFRSADWRSRLAEDNPYVRDLLDSPRHRLVSVVPRSTGSSAGPAS